MATCEFCKKTATQQKVLYTAYTRRGKKIPFREPQKHEFAVCTNHARSEMTAKLKARDERTKSNGKKPTKDLVVYDEAEFEKIQPIFVVYQPVITKEEVELALSIPPIDLKIISDKDIKTSQAKARLDVIKDSLMMVIIAPIVIGIAVLVPHWLFVVIAICTTIATPLFLIYQLWRLIEVSKPARNYNTPEAVAKKFYEEVAGDSEGIVLAFQLLAPTIVNRGQANSVETLKLTWKLVKDGFTTKLDESFKEHLRGERASFTRDFTPTVKVPVKSNRVAKIECSFEYTIGRSNKLLPDHIGWGILHFENLAIRIGGNWYLMAGEPGEIQTQTQSVSKTDRQTIWGISADIGKEFVDNIWDNALQNVLEAFIGK